MDKSIVDLYSLVYLRVVEQLGYQLGYRCVMTGYQLKARLLRTTSHYTLQVYTVAVSYALLSHLLHVVVVSY